MSTDSSPKSDAGLAAPPDVREAHLIAYRVSAWPDMKLVAAARARQWMDDSQNRFAYRCLPLLIANQSGWWILNSHPIRAYWTGGWDRSCVRVESLDGSDRIPASGHFGEGVLTFTLPFLFRTPPRYNLHVRGPANLTKDAIQPLEGLVETDWTMATFTMNWKFTRPHTPVVFEKDEPICMISPEPRGLVESITPLIRDLRAEAAVDSAFRQWWHSRTNFLHGIYSRQPEEVKQGWQKHYFRGVELDGKPAPDHQARLELQEFVEEPYQAANLPSDASRPPLPNVEPHPEALAALKALGSGQMSAEPALQAIRQAASRYLPDQASRPQASLVGALLARALFAQLAAEAPIERITGEWDTAERTPADPRAADVAAGIFAVGCSAASDDPDIEEGQRRLWEHSLKQVLPPPEEMGES